MSKLLAEGLRRLFKGRRFYIVLIVIAAVTAVFPVLSYFVVDSREERGFADSLFLVFAGQIPMFVSIAAGMLICQDFKNNTVRNKIITGHSRTNIYMANLIISLLVMVLYYLTIILVTIPLGYVFMSFEYFPSIGLFKKMLMILAVEIAFTSTIVFICNSLKSTGGFVLALCMHYIFSTLEVFLGIIPYKFHKIVEFVEEVVPSFQITLLVYSTEPDQLPEKWAMMLVSCCVITFATTALGIAAFNRSDLK
jgi:ABC-type transport system involved in multi-copper enzyme maturation permease subunit